MEASTQHDAYTPNEGREPFMHRVFSKLFGRSSEKDTIASLVKQRDASPEPHIINEQINAEELRLQKDELQSYPVYIAINTITACNARCAFCYYYPQVATLPRLGLRDFEAMPWLKNISTLDLYGGLGEPLMNPEFSDIVLHLRQANPFQRLIFTSNGQLINKGIAEILAGKVSTITISINAATKATYEAIMGGCNWDILLKNLEIFQELNLTRPNPTTLSLSYVATRTNIDEAGLLIPLMHSLRINSIGINHFSTSGIWPKRESPRLPRTDSLYFHKNLSDERFSSLKQQFSDADITCNMPPLFSEPSTISFGGRARYGTMSSWRCSAPWNQCYVCHPEPTAYLSQTQADEYWCAPCCSIGADISLLVPFHKEDFITQVWNSSAFKVMRRHSNNLDAMLRACRFCRTTDKSDAQNPFVVLDNLHASSEEIYKILNLQFPDAMEQRRKIIHEEYQRQLNDFEKIAITQRQETLRR